MLDGVVRRLALIVSFSCGCTPSNPSEPSVRSSDAKPAVAEARPAVSEQSIVEPAMPKQAHPQAAAEPEPVEELEPTLVYVMLGGTGSRTSKPVEDAVLGHSWGFGTATEATIAACERENSDSVGKMMWCSTEDKPAGSAKLVRKLRVKPGRSVFVAPEDVASWGIAPPSSPVWLVGPDRVCEATVGRPLVGYYSIDEEGRSSFSDHFTVLELAWELTGCDAASGDWSPIGLSAPEIDPALRWVPEKDGRVERFDPATWKGVLTSKIAQLAPAAADAMPEDHVSDAPEWTMKTFELPGTKIREAYIGAVWRAAESPSDSGKYGCGDTEIGEVFQYQLGGAVIGHGSRGTLSGALVGTAGRVHSLVWSEQDEFVVARLHGSRLGKSTRVSTGASHPESGGAGYALIGYCGP